MKNKLILPFAIFLAFAFFNNKAAAQDTALKFSRVILYDLHADSTKAIAVPANKIWKIEGVSMGSSGSAAAVFLKNASGQNIAYFTSPLSAISGNYPFWLPAGFSGTFINNSPSYRCSISITEYSVVP